MRTSALHASLLFCVPKVDPRGEVVSSAFGLAPCTFPPCGWIFLPSRIPRVIRLRRRDAHSRRMLAIAFPRASSSINLSR